MRTTIFKESRAVPTALWFVFSVVALAGMFAETSTESWTANLVLLIGAAVLFLWLQPRSGIYLEEHTLILQGVLRTNRISLTAIAGVLNPDRGRLRLLMRSGEERVIRVAPVAGRHRLEVYRRLREVVASGLE